MTDFNKPISGKMIFDAIADKPSIIMAANIRIQHCTRGIMQAAKEKNAAVLFEIAKSEIGYTDQKPQEFYDKIVEAANDVGFDTPYAIHGDHITIKKNTPEAIAEAKDLIEAEVAAGFTSYAIDASHNYDLNASNARDALADNIEITVKLADLIPKDVCLEVEVGEVGRKNPDGTKMLTTVEESVTYIEALQEQGVKPHLIALNNGSVHGNIFDADGNIVEQVGIDIERTKAIADAITPLGVRIAQHGITGTPLRLMHLLVEAGIAKGNVGTNWQNIAVANMPPELVSKMEAWTIASEQAAKMKVKKPQMSEKELIAKNIKHSIKPHKSEIETISDEWKKKVADASKASALDFFDAFQSNDTADLVRNG